MYIRSRKYAGKYSERYDHGPEILIGKINPGFIQQNPSIASLSDSVVPGTKWRGGLSRVKRGKLKIQMFFIEIQQSRVRIVRLN